MEDRHSEKAWSKTWDGSKQAFFTAKLIVDKDLRADFARAYSYLRWADDVVDTSSYSREEKASFVDRQADLIERFSRMEHVPGLAPEEEILAGLVARDSHANGGLQSFLRNMIAAIQFDAHRNGRVIDEKELDWYTERVAQSVTDGGEYFIRHSTPDPKGVDRLMAVRACHISHLLRDMMIDIPQGFINIPREYLESNGIGPGDVGADAYRAWVRGRVKLARVYFSAGKRYYDRVDVLRVRLAVRWYCARFEEVLERIERDGFILREGYGGWRKIPMLARMFGVATGVSARHALGRFAGTVLSLGLV